jgi:uncharacterized protein (DUF305 family)
MTEPATDQVADEAGATPDRRRERLLVVIGGALVMFLLGAVAATLVQVAADDTAEPGPVDIGFLQDMTVHHEQAVTMATLARSGAADPRLRQIAYDIESTQTAEIGRMQGWLALWEAPALPLGEHMTWITGSAGHAHHGGGGDDGVTTMPGMASPRELQALRAASGPEFDVLFLQLMLRHHEGGVPMLAHAAEHATVPQVRNFAGGILAAQQNESRLLRNLLAERGAAPLPL